MRLRYFASAALLAGAFLVYGTARDREFVGGPYLADPGARRVAIRGFTRKPARWSVVPRTAGIARVDENAPSTRHDLELAGLPEGATIEVDVLQDGEKLDAGFLRFRADPGPTAARFDFAVVGDSGGAPDRLLEMLGQTPSVGAARRPERIAERISAVRPWLLLHAGDVVYPHGERDDYARAFFRPFASVVATAPVAAAAGNHDLKSEGGLPFLEVFGPRRVPPGGDGKYFSFDFGPLHVVVLNSTVEDRDQLTAQSRWLVDDLRAATRPWKIAVTHVPLIFRSEAHRESVGTKQAEISDVLLRRCIDGGVSAVFCGHDHWYERSNAVEGLVQITTGGGGYSVKTPHPGAYARVEARFHFVHAWTEGDSLWLRPIDDEGNPLEPEPGVRIQRR